MGGATEEAAAWGSVLQEKYANAHAVACCSTMDLIAVLTTDRQLFVHRTISWQRILHVKPSEVYYTMEALAWSPDGMRLAVGCDEGELVVFSMASAGDDKGVEIKPHTGADELSHGAPIVAMHWVQLREGYEGSDGKMVGAPSEPLRDRSASFISGARTTSVGHSDRTSVLVTADAAGKVGVWWNGLVLVAAIPLREHFSARNDPGAVGSELEAFTIHSAMLATDLSALLVDVSYGIGQESACSRAVLRTEFRDSLQAVQRDLSVVSRVGSDVRSKFELVRTSLRQITSEWKNATRVFELKMSLIGSLYEKYGYQEPPQVDMLAIIAGGIAAPALAQYFAQDIQEMSVIRMQKAFFSGCDTIQTLCTSKIKLGLQQILFEVAELRGTMKWNHRAFRQTLGISPTELDMVIDDVGDLLATMEQFEKILDETRQDFSLFFAWLLERIRFHTSDGNARPTPSNSSDSNKSLLNLRRLVAFLECAAQSAREYQVKKNNKWLVEVTFGNQVSKLLNSSKLGDDFNAVENLWSNSMAEMVRALSNSIDSSNVVTLALGDEVDEVQLHTRWIDAPHLQSWSAEDETMSEDDGASEDEAVEGFDVLEAVDWDSLHTIRTEESEEKAQRTPVAMIAARRGHCVTFYSRYEGHSTAEWSTIEVRLDFLCGGGSTACIGAHRIFLYGGMDSGKQEQLVVIDTNDKGAGAGSVYLVNYDGKFQRTFIAMRESYASTVQAFVLGAEHAKRRTIRGSASSSDSPTISAQATRGIVCIISGDARLLVLDAEEGVEEEAGKDDAAGEHGDGDDSDDHDEVDL